MSIVEKNMLTSTGFLQGTVSKDSGGTISTTECTPCIDGWIAATEGLDTCTECTDILTYSNSDNTACVSCPKVCDTERSIGV